MSNLAERKRQRRAYLRKKGVNHVLKALAAAVFYPTVVVTILCRVVLAIVAAIAFFTCIDVMGIFNRQEARVWVAVLIGACVFEPVCRVCGRFYRKGDQLPYIPPVTLDTLPPDEVLVRPSAQPDAPADLLLRVSGGGETESGEELLRAAGQGESKQP